MTTSNVTIPPFQTSVLGAGGVLSRPYYLYLQSLPNTISGGTAALQEQIAQIAIDLGSPDGTVEGIPEINIGNLVPKTTIIVGVNSIVSTGNLPAGQITFSLSGDVSTPVATSFYGADDIGNKGWQPMLGAFAKTGSVNVSAASNGVVSFQADLFYLQATR